MLTEEKLRLLMKEYMSQFSKDKRSQNEYYLTEYERYDVEEFVEFLEEKMKEEEKCCENNVK